LGNLRKLGLQLLQAHDVGLVALHPLAKLRLARADAVDVPGGDFHFREQSLPPRPFGAPLLDEEGKAPLLYDAEFMRRGRAIEEELIPAGVAREVGPA